MDPQAQPAAPSPSSEPAKTPEVVPPEPFVPVAPISATTTPTPLPIAPPTDTLNPAQESTAVASTPVSPSTSPSVTPPSPEPPPQEKMSVPPIGPVATPPRSPWLRGVLGLILLLLLGGVGVFAWRAIRPQSAPVTSPTPQPTAAPTPALDDPTSTPDDEVVCTMDAMQCPDGSFVGRTGPNCEFVCPSEESTKGGQPTTPASSTSESPPTGTASWDTYVNAPYKVSFSFPPGWEVRTLTPPRRDIEFRHGFGPRQNFTAHGYLEVSTLPLNELIDAVKLAEGGSATEQPAGTLGHYQVTKYLITKGSSSVEHWFFVVANKSYHFTATGSVPEVAEVASTLEVE